LTFYIENEIIKYNMAKVLIAEDEKDLLQIYDQAFQDDGFETIAVENGKEGLARALEEHPDLILVDIRMPKMNGIEMLEKLRKDPWGKSVPVVMLTNLSGEQEITDSMHLKINRYIIKVDTTPIEIVKEVKTILSNIKNKLEQNFSNQ